MGVAILNERRRKTSPKPSCPEEERMVDEWLSKLSEAYNTRKPVYTMKAEETCPPQYEACITYPEPLHFKCGVTPNVVAHEYGHWLLKQKGSPHYSNEAVVEGFAQLSLRLLSEQPASFKLKRVSGMPSPLCWPGGKRYLTKELLKRVPHHRVYVEPFAGGAWLFWEKEPAEINVLNDINRDLMDFYRNLREVDELQCDMQPDRERFERIRAKSDKSVCDFLYLNKNSYSCKMDSFTATRRAHSPCFQRGDFTNCQIQKLSANLNKVKSHLSKAILHNRDFREVLAKYDSLDTFFYLDPPYWEPNRKECLYEEHCRVTPEEVAEAVKNLKGKVLISYDVHPKVEAAFDMPGWEKELVDVSYVMAIGGGGATKAKKKKELLLRNY